MRWISLLKAKCQEVLPLVRKRWGTIAMIDLLQQSWFFLAFFSVFFAILLFLVAHFSVQRKRIEGLEQSIRSLYPKMERVVEMQEIQRDCLDMCRHGNAYHFLKELGERCFLQEEIDLLSQMKKKKEFQNARLLEKRWKQLTGEKNRFSFTEKEEPPMYESPPGVTGKVWETSRPVEVTGEDFLSLLAFLFQKEDREKPYIIIQGMSLIPHSDTQRNTFFLSLTLAIYGKYD